jgi:replicative superfamily II helicase
MELKARIIYGVEVKYVPLVSLKNIGKVKATKLYEAGLTTLEKIASSPEAVAKVLKCKMDAAENISKEAKFLSSISTS